MKNSSGRIFHDALYQTSALFESNPVRVYFGIAGLFLLQCPDFLLLFSNPRLEDSIGLTAFQFVLLALQVFLYARLSFVVYKILDERKISLKRQWDETAANSLYFFKVATVFMIVAGLLIDAYYILSRIYVGLPPFGKLLIGHRLWLNFSSNIGFFLTSDFLYVGGWMSAALYCRNDKVSNWISTEAKLNLKKLFQAGFLYSICILISWTGEGLAWCFVWIVAHTLTYFASVYFNLPAHFFLKEIVRSTYQFTYGVVQSFCIVPVYIFLGYVRLNYVRAYAADQAVGQIQPFEHSSFPPKSEENQNL